MLFMFLNYFDKHHTLPHSSLHSIHFVESVIHIYICITNINVFQIFPEYWDQNPAYS